MIRELISKLSGSLSESLVASRRRINAPMRVWFDPDNRGPEAVEKARAACISGEMVDMSRTGVAFQVPFIRLKDKYLVNQDRILNMEIDLPGGRVCMRVLGKRYERVGLETSVERFLVGAHIVSLVGDDKARYDAFLQYGPPRTSTAERVGIVS